MEQRNFSKEEEKFSSLFQTDGIDFDSARKMLAEGLDINACKVDEKRGLDETLLTRERATASFIRTTGQPRLIC